MCLLGLPTVVSKVQVMNKGIGQMISVLLIKGYSNKEVLAMVRKYFADKGETVKTSAACVAWYGVKLRKDGKLVKVKDKVLSEEEVLRRVGLFQEEEVSAE
jgi:hypothetical protein